MPLIPAKTPKVVKTLFPNYVWDIDTSEKVLYLTFDDGPTPKITKWTLNTLGQYNAKATFFCIGANVEKYPGISQKILKAGHTIGNHTQNHLNGWKTETKHYLDNVNIAEDILNSQSVNQKIVNLFRPPYGKITRKQGKKLMGLGYRIVMWDVLSFDWKNDIGKKACLHNVISKAKKGSIIVFHDSVKASKNMKYALPRVLEHFSERGYRFDTLT